MKRFSYTLNEILVLFAIIAIIVIAPLSWIGYSYFEAKAFNNVTGKNVSTFDAMFLELRVIDES